MLSKQAKWARDRNGAKFLLKGITANLKTILGRQSLLTTEKSELKRAIIAIDETLYIWKGRNSLSKKKFMGG